MTSTTTFLLVRQASAAKLSASAAGLIHYVILIDAERTEPHLALTGNDSSGYFSREAVPISALRRCAEQACADTPLTAGAFKSAFTGASTNNTYFASAALCAEGLISRVRRDGPGRGQPLADAGFWDDWTAQVLAQVAEQGNDLPVFHIGKPPAEPAADRVTAERRAVGAEDAAPAGGELASSPDAAVTGETEAHDAANLPADTGMGAANDGAEHASGKNRRKAKVRA